MNNIKVNGQTYDIESVEVRDNEIVLKRKQPEFKAGDVCVNVMGSVFIYQSPCDSRYASHFAWLGGKCSLLPNEIRIGGETLLSGLRHATESERQLLFDELRKQKGLKWNPETMKLEKIRWRAEENGWYYFIAIHESAAVRVRTKDERMDTDNIRYNLGDYFNPNDPTDMAEAQSICDKINAYFAARC